MQSIDLPVNNSMNNSETVTFVSRLMPWFVCFAASLFFFYEFIQMNMFNAINSQVMKAFSLNATQLGFLSINYFYANLLFLFPAGLILDRFSTRKVILCSLSICASGTFLFAISTNFYLATFFRFITGIGSAFCFLSCIRLASRWFPSHRLALISGLIVTMAMTGGMVAQAPLTYLVSILDWRQALMVDAALGFSILFIIWLVVQDYPPHLRAKTQNNPDYTGTSVNLWNSMRLSYLNLQNWLCGLYTSLMNLPFAIFGALWGISYLQQVQHFSAVNASFITSMLFLGTIIGCPIAGWASDQIGKRRSPMVMGSVCCLAIIYLIIFHPFASVLGQSVLFFALGFFTSTQVVSYPTVAESNPSDLTATAVSVVSFSAISGYAISHPLFGKLMDVFWDGTIVNGHRIYPAESYHMALMILPIGFFVALLATFFIRETHCRPQSTR